MYAVNESSDICWRGPGFESHRAYMFKHAMQPCCLLATLSYAKFGILIYIDIDIHYMLNTQTFQVVRMAERSKAPDSRENLLCKICGGVSVLVHECGRGFESHF